MKRIITERPFFRKPQLAAFALGAAIGLSANSVGAQTPTPAQPEQPAQVQQPAPAATPSPQSQAAGAAQQTQPDLSELQQKFVQVSQRINAIQQQAIQDEAVQKKHTEFNTAMNEAILGLNQEAKTLIDEQETLRDKILNNEELTNPGTERSPEFMADVQKYQALEQQLAPMRQQVAQEPAVVEKQKAFESALISKMEEIDPETPKLLSDKDEIVEQYRNAMQRQ